MNQEPNDQNFEYQDDSSSPDHSPRRNGLFSLTGLGARLAATALAIGLGVVILSYAMSSSTDNSASIAQEDPTATINVTPLATWTPGPTSTPPPPANPTPEPAGAGEETAPAAYPDPNDPNAPAGTLGNGSQVKVTGTGGLGVNMRESSGVTFGIIETLADDTVLEIINGPVDADGWTWWQVRLEDGREGWVVQDFVVPN